MPRCKAKEKSRTSWSPYLPSYEHVEKPRCGGVLLTMLNDTFYISREIWSFRMFMFVVEALNEFCTH